ncbi:hypothetical protein PTTG_27975 [Puccinia triticina 1-1 BBBD Race 1]|uniref:Uncharacterized protein n=1 Tax=Puccinia triticina (isolate 1-1 / race 1 (BBBD)) TaxID=630390 RepID=A0A180GFJ7_PUCT1|nr:hypothetical protein PTTG_27975 [Puccinia triticina 1-1 BBBD Race 1]
MDVHLQQCKKKQLNSAKIFKQFLLAAKVTPESHQIICCLVQKDPTVLAQKDSVYKHLRLIFTGPSSAEDPSAGAQAAATLTDLVAELGCIHKPAQNLTGSHKTGVFINLENPNKFFQIALWAKAILPIQDQGRHATAASSSSSATTNSGSSFHRLSPFPHLIWCCNAPGMFFNPMHMAAATTMTMPPLMNVGTSQNLPSTPEHLNAEELASKGIPKDPAQLIVSSTENCPHHSMRASQNK